MINWLYKICVDIVWAVSFVFEGCLSDNLLSTETLLSIGGPETLAVAVTHAGGHHTAYAYDCENRLVSVTPVSPSSGDLAIVNEYDHMNRRVRKTVRRYDGAVWSDQERHSFVWDGWNIVLERIDAGGSVTRMIEYYWGEDFSGTEQGAGNAPVAKRSGRLSEANPKGRKGPRVGGLLAVSYDGELYVPIYGGNGNIVGYADEKRSAGTSKYSHIILYKAWGSYSWSLHPEAGTQTHGRSGFFIHGGLNWGSAGCIDIKSGDVKFNDFLKGLCKCYIPIIVKYELQQDKKTEREITWHYNLAPYNVPYVR